MKTQDEIALDRASRLPETERQLFGAFVGLDMSPAAALRATEGRDGQLPSSDSAEEFVESFERMGLSRSGAEVAALGRQSDPGNPSSLRELRERLDAAERRPAGGTIAADEEKELLERRRFSVQLQTSKGVPLVEAQRHARELWTPEVLRRHLDLREGRRSE